MPNPEDTQTPNNASPPQWDAIVIGAGISGLTAAYTLHQAGRKVLVVEAGQTPGGLIQSIREGSTEEGCFQMEAGPNTFPSTAKELLELAHQLELSPQPASPKANKRYLYLHGQLTALPGKPPEALTTPVLSLAGKLRVLLEPFQPRTQTEDISVADFVSQRLGKEVLNHLVDPFISGIYAGDVTKLSLPAVFPKLWEWEQAGGSLLQGARQAQKKAHQARRESGQPTRPPMTLLSFAQGLGALPQALAMAIPAEQILYGRTVSAISATPLDYPPQTKPPTTDDLADKESTGKEPIAPSANTPGYTITTQTGETFCASHVILATPAHVASPLLAALCPVASQALGEIPYNSLTVTHVGLPQTALPHPLDGFGCLIPQREKRPLLGVIWASSLFPERAPSGQVLLSCFAGGAHHPEIFNQPPEAIQQLVLEELQHLFNAPQALQPTFCKILKYEKAIPQYTFGHKARIATAENALASQHPRIHLCGNHLHGIALNECVKSGQAAAYRVTS